MVDSRSKSSNLVAATDKDFVSCICEMSLPRPNQCSERTKFRARQHIQELTLMFLSRRAGAVRLEERRVCGEELFGESIVAADVELLVRVLAVPEPG